MAIKKTTTKSAKSPSPAPATKPAKSATKTTPVPAAVPADVSPVTLAVAALSAVVPPKAIAAQPVTTTVVAAIDVGFGNALFIRGDGPGLSWDKGVEMECVAGDQWQIALGESSRPYLVKFLINDLTWSTGPDYTVPSGISVTLAPQF